MKPSDYLAHYATKFKTVEIDSHYYKPPSSTTVIRWRKKTRQQRESKEWT